jgi:hypothetical protein
VTDIPIRRERKPGMLRVIVIYGLVSGLVIILGIMGTMFLAGGHSSVWLGYLIMLVALSSILVGVKSYRDQAGGGVIRFLTAFGVGLGIAVVASIAYVVVWEIYLASTHYTFMDKYTAHILAAKRAAGVTGEAYARAVAETDRMRAAYANPLVRAGMTFAEIFPVGLLVAIVTAALVRNPKFLPARVRA